MKLIAISDLHGELIKIPEEFDLLLIAGDISPTHDNNRWYQKQWLETEFVDWINNLPYKNDYSRVVMCAGNHDLVFENMTMSMQGSWLSKINDNRLIYLDNEEYTFVSDDHVPYRIFGCPYCKMFGSWAFMRENLTKYYDPIPAGLDMLITHDAADIDGLGMITEGRGAGINAGNTILAEYVRDRKPRYYFCGHIHSGRHEIKETDGTMSANVSIMNERYCQSNRPLIIEI